MPDLKTRLFSGLALFSLVFAAACTDPATKLANADIAGAADECTSRTAQGETCRFRNAPLQLAARPIKIPGRPYTFYPMARSLAFVDGGGTTWTAPQGTLTDGASIPEIFVPIVGSPREKEFADAAALHDAYCGIGNEDGSFYHAATWQQVHRMFYDTLVSGGTPELKAKVMFAAVWLAGPRWKAQEKGTTRHLAGVPESLVLAAMKKAEKHIIRLNPPLPELIIYLGRIEREMIAESTRESGDRPVQLPGNQGPPGPIFGGGGQVVGGGGLVALP